MIGAATAMASRRRRATPPPAIDRGTPETLAKRRKDCLEEMRLADPPLLTPDQVEAGRAIAVAYAVITADVASGISDPGRVGWSRRVMTDAEAELVAHYDRWATEARQRRISPYRVLDVVSDNQPWAMQLGTLRAALDLWRLTRKRS